MLSVAPPCRPSPPNPARAAAAMAGRAAFRGCPAPPGAGHADRIA